ncbi:ion transporter [Azospirillum agricola]|uniref:ion transporter n=1 Tax=Azospirillum agricola TaxID=1720247 RepID=UPI000A0F0B0A|nr:ion transporter [Azospirillum agricola]SMH60384.1 voltage-gated potassium channel [Azospirillum lipoferum]
MSDEAGALSDTDRLLKLKSLRAKIRFLYEAHTSFRMGMAGFDLATVLFFLVTTFLPPSGWILWVDYVLGFLLLTDMLARGWIARNRRRFFLSVWTLADVVVILSMLAPIFTSDYAFLRVLRAMRLLRSYALLRNLRRGNRWVAERGEMMLAVVNLVVFVFVVSAFVYVTQIGRNDRIVSYIDAMYFTVTTLTTTGFGDITLVGTHGRLMSVVIMLLGVGLFLKFAQSLFRPNKAHVECPACGLSRHDFDAIHCKHCGGVIHIDDKPSD